VLSVSLLTLAACATVELPELHPGITLPASGDGYQIDTITGKEVRIPADKWQEKLPRGIILFSDDWATLKYTLLKNCFQDARCERMKTTVDTLFQTVDQALGKIPGR